MSDRPAESFSVLFDNADWDSEDLPEARRFLVFQLGDASFIVEITDVQRVLRFQATTPVPKAPAFVTGVTSVEGMVIPVIDLPKRFRLGGDGNPEDRRLIVVNLPTGSVGLGVDSATEIEEIPESSFRPAPEIVQGIGGEYIVGVAEWKGRLFIQLDLTHILSVEEIAALADLEIGLADDDGEA